MKFLYSNPAGCRRHLLKDQRLLEVRRLLEDRRLLEVRRLSEDRR